MRILFASSEAVPFAKTGGLADVSGALPRALSKFGHDVTLILPAYRKSLDAGFPIESLGIEFIVPIGTKTVTGRLLKSHLPGSDVSVYLVEQAQYFDRDDLYGEGGKDFSDNCERFVFFSRAVMEAIRLLHLQVDVIHANDWQTGLVPAYLDAQYRLMPRYEKIASVYTIHNLAYQGVFWHWDMLLTGLDWQYFNYHQMEYFGKLNLLKTGLAFADALTTVSPRYALEIQSEDFGCGLEGLLRHRSGVLQGILNGVDCEHWNPATDQCIAQQYDSTTWQEGKQACKTDLQKEMGLPIRAKTPVIGIVSRLAHQKGCDLIGDLMADWCPLRDIQWVILGTGEPRIEDHFRELERKYPQNVAVKIAFSDAMAHKIEAGSDMFLMPSRYEPCGLNQQYSLIYGTVPVVHETGGLADTVIDLEPKTLTNGTANGFRFRRDSLVEMAAALDRACDVYWNQPDVWRQLVENGMKPDRSWDHSAEQYTQLYEKTIRRVVG